jgi:hypothetical protein
MVELVAPKDGDEDNSFTVEQLLRDQKKALRPSWYKYPRSSGPRPDEPYGPKFAEMFPVVVGSIAAFERAVIKDRVIESEFHTFDADEVMDVFRTRFEPTQPSSNDAPQSLEQPLLISTPGPKAGESAKAGLAWQLALEVLSDDSLRPAPGYGWLAQLARKVNSKLKKRGFQYRDDSIRRMIQPSAREWERKQTRASSKSG